MGPTTEPSAGQSRLAGPSTVTDHRLAGGPPRFFALTVTRAGTLLAGTCGRGTSRSRDGGRTWTPVEGPGNGVVHDFAVAPDGTILASTGGSGVHRSTDDGRTWRPVGLDGRVLYGLKAQPELVVGSHGEGLARSADGGDTWSVGVGPAATTVYRVLHVGGSQTLVATQDQGIWASTGDAWRPVGLAGLSVYALVQLDDSVVIAGTRGGGLHRSVDGGNTWEVAHPMRPDPDIHTLVIDADGSVLAGTGHGVHRSRDQGATWEPVGAELGSRRIFSLASTGSELVAGSYDGVWRWSDPGRGWEPVDTGLSPGEAFTIGPAVGGTLLAGTKAGALVSDDAGLRWRTLSALGGCTVHATCATSGGELLVGTDDGVRSSADPTHPDSGEWIAAGLAGHWVFTLLEVDNGRVLAGTLGQGAFSRDPDGWQSSNEGLPHPNVYDLHPTGDGAVLAATGIPLEGGKSGGIFRSSDGGRSWMATSHEPITVYRVVEDSTGRLFAGAQRCHVLVSEDGGSTWTTSPPPVDDLKMYCLAIDDADRLYLGAGALLLRSEDGAATWEEVGEGLDGLTTYDLVHHEAVLVAATSAGVFRSEDDGATWRAATVE